MIVEEIKLQEGITDTALIAYLQDLDFGDQKRTDRPAVILCPGGAYLGYTEKEVEPIALRFLSEGFQVFVLKYSIGEMARFPAPFLDAAKAVMLVREHARHWKIHPDRISLCGFSTGAQVVAALGARWQEPYLAKALNAEGDRFRPNALILGSPVLDMERFYEKHQGKSREMSTLIEMMFCCIYGTATPTKKDILEWDIKSRINSTYPPTFMWTTREDSLVDVEQCLDYINAFDSNMVPYEFHIFHKGAPGSGAVNPCAGNASKWVELALQWLGDVMGPTFTTS